MARKLLREERIRYFTRNGIHYRIVISWHFLQTGEKYYYIHVYRSGDRPIRTWRWVTTFDDQFIDWA